jgi:hypothetical protein
MRNAEQEAEEWRAAALAWADKAERLRGALQDAKDLALADAPAHMIVDVCDRALALPE